MNRNKIATELVRLAKILVARPFREGTGTHFEAELKKAVAKGLFGSYSVDIDMEFVTRREKTFAKVIVTGPDSEWYWNLAKENPESIPQFNRLVSQFGVDYKVTGKRIVIG